MIPPEDPLEPDPEEYAVLPQDGIPPVDPGMPLEEDYLDEEPVIEPLLPPRPAAAVDYTVHLSQEDLDDLGRRIITEFDAYRNATEERRELAKEWRADAKLRMSNQPTPWKDASQIRAPFLAMAADAHRSRLNGHIGSGNPPWSAIPEDEGASENVSQLERAVKAALESAHWDMVKRELHRELPVVTPAAIKTEWDREVCRYPEPAVEQDQEALASLIEAQVNPLTAYTATVDRGPNGLARQKLKFSEKLIREGPKYTVVPFERLVMFPVTAPSRKELWGIGERMLVRGMDLYQGIEPGKDAEGGITHFPRYLKKQVLELLEMTGDMPDTDVIEEGEEQGVDFGTSTPSRENLYKTFECLELDWYDDLNKDGEMEWYLILIHIPSRRVLRCQYCADQHGMSRYEVFGYMEETGNLFGMSLAEKLQYLQDGVTACLNQFVNMQDKLVGTAGNFFYDQRAKRLRPDQWYIDPAEPIEVDDINGIKENPLAAGITAALGPLLQAISLFKEWFDLLTAANNIALGNVSEGDKTLGEARMAQHQTNTIFEDYAAGVAESWEKVIQRTASLIGQYSEGGQFKYRTESNTGGFQFDAAPSGIFESRVTWACTGLTQLPDMQSRVQRDMMVKALIDSSPLTQTAWKIQYLVMKETLQDLQFPGWQKIAKDVEMQAAMLIQTEMAMNAAGANAAQQQDAVAQQEQERGMAEEGRAQNAERRAEEQHQIGSLATLQQIANPPEEKKPTNGSKKS